MDYGNIILRADGSYVITKDGMPYHIPCGWGEWAKVHEYALANPECVTEEAAPPAPAFGDLKAAKRREIWGAGDAILAEVKANFTEAEIESWSKQERGAKDISAGDNETEAALFVAAIAARRGITASALASKILANVAIYGALSVAVIGEQQRLDDLIKTAETPEDLAAISWTWTPPEE